AIKTTASFGRLTFASGAEGSSVMGLVVIRIDVNIPDVIVRRNNIGNLYLNSENFFVSQNFIYDEIAGTNCKGMVTNNIIRYAGFNANSSVSVFNNVFYYSSSSFSSLDIHNSEIRNNIIVTYTNNSLLASSRNNTVTNNIFRQNGTDSNGNQFNQAVASVIVNEGSEDGKYRLTDNSPANGAGLNGVDCGAFGGDNPYVL